MKKTSKAFIVATLLSLGVAGTASAQETAATPTIPTAAECTIEPISFDRLATIAATPAADPSLLPAASPVAPGLPTGEAADDETTAAVQGVVTQLIACINAGDSLRTLALYSDKFITRGFAGLDITQEMYDAEAGNLQPRPAGQEVALIGFEDAVVMADGRVALVVKGDDLSTPGTSSGTLFTLIKVGDQWLIDETNELQGGTE